MALLTTGTHTHIPMCITQAGDGALYFSNGLDRPLRWDGLTPKTELAGISPPADPATVAFSGSGTICGTYDCYVRFLDDDDIPSNFSPVTTVTITTGVVASQFDWTNVPTTSNARVVKRELYRNTAGQRHTYYCSGVINDNSTTTHSDSRTDGELVAHTAIRYETAEGWPNANRHGVPPDWMGVVVSFQDRSWYLVPTEYNSGDVSISGTDLASAGARFTPHMVGRKVYAAGSLKGTVDTVPSYTSITLSSAPGAGWGSGEGYYAIGPEEDERNRVHFSGAGEPESFPLDDDGNYTNVLTLQEDGDFLTAAMPYDSYLFLLKNRHIYRLSTAGDPRRDGTVHLVAERGCINQRTWCRAEGVAFIMDRSGIYAFDGRQVQPVSGAVQDYFRGRINFTFAKWFHAEHSPDEEAVRFFVALDSDIWPQHALRFSYRLQQWSLEKYPFDIGASAGCPLGGEWRLIAGANEHVALMNEGTFDGGAPDCALQTSIVTVTETVRGTVTASGNTTIRDSAADFSFSNWLDSPTNMKAPIQVIDTNGAVQTRRITAATGTTITVDSAWTTNPSVGDAYQIGGIEYKAKFGAFQFFESDRENERAVRISFRPQTETGTANVLEYYNYSTTARTAHIKFDNGAGVVKENGAVSSKVDLTEAEGHAWMRFNRSHEAHAPADRFVELEVNGVSGRERTKFYAVDIEGVQ